MSCSHGGGSYFTRNVAVLAPDGRLVIIATQDGAMGEADLRTVMAKRLVITGSMLRPRTSSSNGACAMNCWARSGHDRQRAAEARGRSRVSMSEAAAAHAYFESGVHIGKIVLDFTS